MTRIKKLLPVIHISDLYQTLRNVEIANKAGADGVFLINHGEMSMSLYDTAYNVNKAFPDTWLGWNCLGLETVYAFSGLPEFLKGMWADNAHIHEGKDGELSLETAKTIASNRAMDASFEGLYFGGFAFKYTQQPKDLEQAAQHARNYIDVITTSGPGTGHAADVDKISRIRSAIGDHPLAIASGITPENVGEFLPYVDYFLVATGISDSFHELNADKTRALRDRIKS